MVAFALAINGPTRSCFYQKRSWWWLDDTKSPDRLLSREIMMRGGQNKTDRDLV
jgi:hypothetical protein